MRLPPMPVGDLRRSIDGIDPALNARIAAVFAGEAPWPLLLTGGVGTGKSCAALAWLDRCCCSRRYVVAADYVDAAMAAARGDLFDKGGRRVGVAEHRREWADAEVTVMDELGGRDKVADWHYEIIKRAIDARLNKPAVWVTNLSLEGPCSLGAVYDDRIASRLAEGTVIVFDGEDRRVRR